MKKQEGYFYAPVLFTTDNLPENTLGISSIQIKRQGNILATGLFISNLSEGKNCANSERMMQVYLIENKLIAKYISWQFRYFIDCLTT